ncbi:MAG: thiamine pyrophosphate-binding protein [Rhodospirillales bacterium]|nr:thiamine pyrophosphate-binding protein [Rhodospirillales bacterium]
MTGAEFIAEYLARIGVRNVYLMTGGAAAFLIDAVARHPKLDYQCMLHEQSAAMAADAVWRTSGRLGVTMATSGPGATNLLTGIACSYFDSIPSLHITGQVNKRESAAYLGADVRQAGFQETKIVDMARPITKYAVMVESVEQLREELPKAVEFAFSGRMGPVLIDVPMNVQQDEMGDFGDVPMPGMEKMAADAASLDDAVAAIDRHFEDAERPLVLFGAGVGLAGAGDAVAGWLADTGLPFVSSWNGMTYFDHAAPGYLGGIGVYGNRGANFAIQNADRLLVLGSRLDNRQRSGNSSNFANGAKVLVVDVDTEELKKYAADGYETLTLDLRHIPDVLSKVSRPRSSDAWRDYTAEMRDRYLGKNASTFAERRNTLSPYDVIRRMNDMIDADAIVANDTGAAVCWFFQTFMRTGQTIFTAGGNSPMGYSLPAAIAAKIEQPEKQVICCTGDGGFQLNIQELQTLKANGLDITVVVFNNAGFGIIKQFQDSYLGSRYEATGKGYSSPDFGKVADAYGLAYKRIENLDDMSDDLFRTKGGMLLDVHLDPNTLIEPKLEMGRPINDQFPYTDDGEYQSGNRFVDYPRKK